MPLLHWKIILGYLIPRYFPCSFENTCVVEKGLPDFHLMTLTVLRKTFKKYQPKTINYRSYKRFSSEKYREMLINNLPKEKKTLLIMMMVSKDSVT